MTLEELENTLPNGLHDSELQRVIVDYEQHKLILEVAVWVGNMDDPRERREAYKSGRIEVSGLIFLAMEQPDPKYPFGDSAKLTIDGCNMSENIDGELLKSLPDDAWSRSLWVNEWNAFIHIAARDAEIAWINGGAVTYR
jgi:hypothetical protein